MVGHFFGLVSNEHDGFLMRTPACTVFAKDKLEFKVTYWIKYFEDCAEFLLGKDTRRPIPMINKTSRRVALQSPLGAFLVVSVIVSFT